MTRPAVAIPFTKTAKVINTTVRHEYIFYSVIYHTQKATFKRFSEANCGPNIEALPGHYTGTVKAETLFIFRLDLSPLHQYTVNVY
jgi:hypothetical protein